MGIRHAGLDLIEKAGRRLGLRITSEWRAQCWEIARLTAEILQRMEVDTVLDVGANDGRYYDFLRRVAGYRGPVVSFEPIPHMAEVLQDRPPDGSWVIRQHALGARTETRSFNVMATTLFSSFLEPDASAVGQFSAENRVASRIEVPVRRLDEVIDELGLGQGRLYLKLDTQGFDLEVIKGIGDRIGRICALQTEASLKPIYRGMPDFAATLRTLDALGFELAGVFPVTRDPALRLIEADCIAVNRSFCGG